MNMKTLMAGASSAALLALCAGAAQAQIATAAPAAPAPAAAEPDQLSEVIVTATKRETNLQKTPIAISVISADQLAARHAESLISLQDGSIPSLRVATFEARQSALTVGIRGIVPFDANQTARDQGVGVYIDGIYLGRQQGLNAALLDIDRLEVLRGPQGTLFGRNTEGGALNIVTKAPTGVFGGRVVAGLGNYGSYNAEIHQDFAEFAHTSIKIDALVQHQDPTVKNPATGQAGWNQYDRRGVRASALFAPTSNFSALLSVDYVKDENTPFFSQLVNFNPYGKRVRTAAELATGPAGAPAGTINPLASLVQVHTDRQTKSDIGTIQQPSLDKTGGVSLMMKYKLSPDLELRSITGFRSVATNQWDNSGVEARNVYAPNANFGRYSLSDLYQNQVSQEFQAVGDLFNHSVSYVAGLYYFGEDVKESAATPFTNMWNATGTAFTIRNSGGVAPYNNAANGGWERGTRFITRASEATANSYAAYGQATYTPDRFDRLHLTVGGRVTKDTRNGTLYTVNGRATAFTFKYDDTRFDPLVNVAFDLTPAINLYAKYSTGYRAGGANDRSATFTPFAAEEVTAYEIGAKGDFFDRRLRVNLAAYAMDRDNTQIDFDSVDTTPGSPTQGAHTEETRNAPGTSELRGFEADVTAKIAQGLTAGVSYAYTHTKVPATPFPFTGNNFIAVGVPFPVNVVYTPENAASAFIDYERPLGKLTLRGHFDLNYADPQYAFQSEFADISPTAVNIQPVAVKTDSSFVMNANIALADINIGNAATATVSFWVRNLADEEHIYRISAANRGTIGDYANFNPPRTFGVELRAKY